MTTYGHPPSTVPNAAGDLRSSTIDVLARTPDRTVCVDQWKSAWKYSLELNVLK